MGPLDIIPVADGLDKHMKWVGPIFESALPANGTPENGLPPHLVILSSSVTKWQFVRVAGVEYVEVYTVNIGTILGPSHSSVYMETIQAHDAGGGHVSASRINEALFLIIRDSDRVCQKRAALSPISSGDCISGAACPPPHLEERGAHGPENCLEDADDSCPDSVDDDSSCSSDPDDSCERVHFRLIYRIPVNAWGAASSMPPSGVGSKEYLFSMDCTVNSFAVVKVPRWLWHWGESGGKSEGGKLARGRSERGRPVQARKRVGITAKESCDQWWKRGPIEN